MKTDAVFRSIVMSQRDLLVEQEDKGLIKLAEITGGERYMAHFMLHT